MFFLFVITENSSIW